MHFYLGALLLASCGWAWGASDDLRIQHWERCGNLFDAKKIEICLTVTGSAADKANIRFNDKIVPSVRIRREQRGLRVTFRRNEMVSGPLWIEESGRQSNAVWISRGDSYVAAAGENEVVKNADGITTYLNLVSLIIEERYDGLQESLALAKKYNATVVGTIPPLNLYQLRLPVRNLIERDALILRLSSEIQVDAVVIEETSPEKSAEGEVAETADKNRERSANRFWDAVDFYRKRIPVKQRHPIRVGIVERDLDFDAPDFHDYLAGCRGDKSRICVYARDADSADDHGSTVTGILAASWDGGGNEGFLRGLAPAESRFDIIVDRNSDAGVTANIAASVNMVEDGVRVLNWSWGFHRLGTKNSENRTLDSSVRSGLAMSGYEELLEEFFLWLRARHPNVIVVNSAGNSAAFSGRDEYRLPSSLVTEQLLVVGGHELNNGDNTDVSDPAFAKKRDSSNLDSRVDISAAACSYGSVTKAEEKAKLHCGTSYAAPLVTATIAAMLSINPELTPEQLRILLRRSAMAIGPDADLEKPDADDLTAPILPSERNQQLNHPHVGRSARLDMQSALDLAAQSLGRAR